MAKSKFVLSDEQAKKIADLINGRMRERGDSFQKVSEITGINVAEIYRLSTAAKGKINIFYIMPLSEYLNVKPTLVLNILGINTSGLPKVDQIERSKLNEEQLKELERMKGAVLLAVHLNNTNPNNSEKQELDSILERMFISGVSDKEKKIT